MSGEKNNGIDWQSELKARLEAYEKRTGRRISGKRSGEDIPEEQQEASPGGDEKEAPVSRAEKEEAVPESQPELEPPGQPVQEKGGEPEPDEDDEYPVGPDFLAVLDGVDEDDDEDAFLFRERLSRDTDPEDHHEIFDSFRPSGSTEEDDDSGFDGLSPEPEEEGLYRDPVVKVVNIEEFRMDSSAEEVFVPFKGEAPPVVLEEPEPEEEEEVSKEIIVSRLLGGAVDMVISIIIAAGFMEIVAWKLSLNFFELGILKWIGIFAVFVYIFNCLYFLTLVQRTPGMLLTELKLNASKGGKAVSFLQVLARTLAFFPSALSVTGLVWSFFDYQARCLHDIISGTRVVSTRM